MTPSTCNHEDCDCLTCRTCGTLGPEGTGETITVQVGEDWDSEWLCPGCAAKEMAAEEARWEAANRPFDPADEIPF